MSESEPILLSEKISEKNTWTMVKPHLFTILLVLLSVVVVLVTNILSKDATPIIIFILILLVPILIIFKNSLPDSIPYPIRKLLVEDEERPKPTPEEVKDFPKTTIKKRQTYLSVVMGFTSLLIVFLLAKIYPDVKPTSSFQNTINNKTALKIGATLFLICFQGALVINFQELMNLPITETIDDSND